MTERCLCLTRRAISAPTRSPPSGSIQDEGAARRAALAEFDLQKRRYAPSEASEALLLSLGWQRSCRPERDQQVYNGEGFCGHF